jgi:hypothetical protein
VDSMLKRRLVGGAAGLALLAGGGGAYAITKKSGDSERQAFLNDVAKRLNVSPQDLESAFKGALSDKLDADVKAGRLTQAQADAIKRRLAQHGGLPFLGGPGRFGGPPPPAGLPPLGGPPPPFGPGGPPPRGPHGPFGAGLDAAAKYLGLTDAALRRQLESGKSLAQIAADRNKPVDGLKSAIEDAVKAELDKAVADKRITADQETEALGELHSRIDDIVNRKPGFGPPRGDRRHWRHGPHW